MGNVLPTDEREALMDNFVQALLTEQSLAKNIHVIFRFLKQYIPFTQLLCYAVDRRRCMLTPWVCLDEGGPKPMPETIGFRPEDLRLDDVDVLDEEHSLILVNDASQSASYARYKDLLLHDTRAMLILNLRTEPDQTFVMSFHSNEAHCFSPRHAAMLYALKTPLTMMLQALLFDDASRAEEAHGRQEWKNPLELLRQCRGLSGVVRQIEIVAPTESLVLIQGETGVGKELVADSIHLLSSRKNGPLVKVNCSAMPDTLIDNELFGHEKGAFTNASAMHQGYFEQAHNGTLFLDEIGDLSLAAQARLLRVLETHEIQRVGGAPRISVNVRLIAATHKNLAAMVETGEFRQDLWFRLQVFPVFIPPLRERREDIGVIARYAYEIKTAELGLDSPPALSSAALNDLLLYSWPGNVRQLMHSVERALILARGWGEAELSFEKTSLEALTGNSTPFPHRAEENGAGRTLDEYMADHIRAALAECGGRIEGREGAAERLGVHPNTLRGRMKRLGVTRSRQRRA